MSRQPVQPMQPIVFDKHGTARFQENRIINWLFNTGQLSLNMIAIDAPEQHFSRNDRMQLAQLLGYSVGGFADLNYSTDEAIAEADAIVARMVAEREAKKK